MAKLVVALTALMTAFKMSPTAALPPSCSCEQFCSVAGCPAGPGWPAPGGEYGRKENLTLYRVTPGNVTDLHDHNTGTAAGDMGFLLCVSFACVAQWL
jgi:hypothetical protein